MRQFTLAAGCHIDAQIAMADSERQQNYESLPRKTGGRRGREGQKEGRLPLPPPPSPKSERSGEGNWQKGGAGRQRPLPRRQKSFMAQEHVRRGKTRAAAPGAALRTLQSREFRESINPDNIDNLHKSRRGFMNDNRRRTEIELARADAYGH